MMDDFFDDAVLEFDRFFEAMVQELESRGEISNTIFVIHTDHSMRFEVVTRLPLIFIFPDEAHAGIISSNVQNLDIPETLLDYMGIPSPHWMKGQSLISGELPRLRPVFITSHLQPKLNDKGLLSANKAYYKPPYYNLHTAPCTKIEVPGEEEVIRIINAHLEKSGYKMLENTKIAIK
ncbi:MAG: hypothetical protein JRJ02_10045 [Deltaproteobacteria bacterium]|nr:hypothetical protein [Deltaproteobacteria bacterium]